MKISQRDAQILAHIIEYCDEIEATVKWFGQSKKKFEEEFIYLNACSMPLLQIGELAKKFSEQFTESTSDRIPWKNIEGMRDFFAHQYRFMDKDLIWETINSQVPELNKNCKMILKENHLE